MRTESVIANIFFLFYDSFFLNVFFPLAIYLMSTRIANTKGKTDLFNFSTSLFSQENKSQT